MLRKLGKTGIEVSEVGFGAWQLGNTREDGSTGQDAVKLVQKAIELGCNFFDTAPNYAGGKSEENLGKALKNKRENVVINSKFGHSPDGVIDFDSSLIRDSVEGSLKRLQTDHLDSVLLHNPDFEILEGKTDHFDILAELKAEGKIKAYGASVDTSKEIFALLNNTDAEVIEIMFNIFHQEPREAFAEANKKGVGLIVKVPLDSGWLTGKYDSNSSFTGIRERWSEAEIKRRGELVEDIREIKAEDTSMVHEAISFILSYSEISTVIPGVRNTKQLTHNLAARDLRMDEAKLKKYEKLYNDKIKDNPLNW